MLGSILGTENVAMNKTEKIFSALWHLYPNGEDEQQRRQISISVESKLKKVQHRKELSSKVVEVLQTRDICLEPRQSSGGGKMDSE